MSTFEQQRKNLIETCTLLADELKECLPQSNHLEGLEHLIQDLKDNRQIITVLGEFKRGKSTLLNAIIGEEILASDITPATASVNVIHPSAHRELTIEYTNGQIEEKELSLLELQELTYEGEIDHTQVKRVTINLPIHNLDEKIILVDTPGVGDLNDHQADVTYSYIPRSDLILFVIDATTPLRKTELQYLKDTVIPLRKGEILFVLNFMDRIDEDEVEEVMDFVKKRLKKIIPNEDICLYPISAVEALEGDGNKEFVHLLSGIQQKVVTGRMSENKASFYQERFQHVLRLIQQDLIKMDQLFKMSQAELQRGFEEVQLFMDEADSRKEKLVQYGHDRKKDIYMIVRKSLDYFHNHLVELVREEIDAFYGGSFEQYIEKTLPVLIKRQMDSWLNNNTNNIEVMMKKFETEVVSGLNKAFQNGSRNLGYSLSPVSAHSIERVRFSGEGLSSNATLTSGLIAGGAAAAFVAMGGFILLPVLSLAGMPLLNKYLTEKKLQQAKERAIPEVINAVADVIDKLKGALEDYIDQTIESIIDAAQTVFEEEFRRYKMEMEQTLAKRKSKQDQLLPSKEKYLNLKQMIQQQSTILLEV